MSSSDLTEVLVVDVDGTFCPVDTLSLLRWRWRFRHPLRLRQLQQWRKVSKQHEKCCLWAAVGFGKGFKPNPRVLDLMENHKKAGARVVLASGSCQGLVEWAAMQVPNLIDDSFGSDEQMNLTKSQKANFLSQQFQNMNVTYVGDSVDDYHVWKVVSGAVVISGYGIKVEEVLDICPITQVLDRVNLAQRARARTALLFSPFPSSK